MCLKIYNLIINCFTKKYFQFKGRATRTEYNSFWLFCFFISCLIDIVLFLLNVEVNYQSIIKPSTIIFNCITVLPSLSVTARRLHDELLSNVVYEKNWLCPIDCVNSHKL
jgi:uncharacterized membrane protein YhaH (DUF805 family)